MNKIWYHHLLIQFPTLETLAWVLKATTQFGGETFLILCSIKLNTKNNEEGKSHTYIVTLKQPIQGKVEKLEHKCQQGAYNFAISLIWDKWYQEDTITSHVSSINVLRYIDSLYIDI
jgi:hypothetical protein